MQFNDNVKLDYYKQFSLGYEWKKLILNEVLLLIVFACQLIQGLQLLFKWDNAYDYWLNIIGCLLFVNIIYLIAPILKRMVKKTSAILFLLSFVISEISVIGIIGNIHNLSQLMLAFTILVVFKVFKVLNIIKQKVRGK